MAKLLETHPNIHRNRLKNMDKIQKNQRILPKTILHQRHDQPRQNIPSTNIQHDRRIRNNTNDLQLARIPTKNKNPNTRRNTNRNNNNNPRLPLNILRSNKKRKKLGKQIQPRTTKNIQTNTRHPRQTNQEVNKLIKITDTIKKIICTTKIKKKYLQKNKELLQKKDQLMPWNIYSTGQKETIEQHIKRFTWIHFFFKAKIITISLALLKFFFGKKFNNKIPDYWYNKNLTLFNEAFEEAIFLWHKHFLKNINPNNQGKQHTDEEIKKSITTHQSTKELKFMRDILLTNVQIDSAYRELFNIILFCITKKIQKEYGGKLDINHPLYISKNIRDIKYYIIGKTIAKPQHTHVKVQPKKEV